MLTLWWKWRKEPGGAEPGVSAGKALLAAGIGSALSLLAAAVVAPPTAWAGTVTVQPGQNLTQIAAELHTSVGALAAANGLSDPNRVLAGELLQIPSSGQGGAGTTAAVVVQPGQTLSAIAARYGVSVASLAAANGLFDPNRVLAGAMLQVPGSAPGAGNGSSGASGGTTVVRVQPGQTLSAIAARYGVSVASLAAANALHDPNYIVAGTTLVVPRASAMELADYAVPTAGAPSTGGLPAQLAAHPERLTLRPAFAAAATTYGVPLPLLEALCWWESGWQAAIVSPTGAVGVCQIEPSTADFIDQYLAQSALDPRLASQNIDLGAAYLGSLLRATGGDVAQALAGYYQGLASVRRYGMSVATADYVKGIEAYSAIFAAG